MRCKLEGRVNKGIDETVHVTSNLKINTMNNEKNSVKRLPKHENAGLRIIHKNLKPHGIRDNGGYLLFFPEITKYEGQEDRYTKEIEAQNRLAELLLGSLQDA